MKLFDAVRRFLSRDAVTGGAPDALSRTKVSEAIIDGIRDRDPLVRAISIDLAGRIREKAAFPEVAAALKDPLEYLRKKAALALGNYGDKRALPALIASLEDGSEEVRVAVTGVLGHLRDRTAVPALIETLQDPGAHARMSAAISLGCIGDAKAIPALARATKDPSEMVRKYACEALGRIGRPAVPALLEAMKDVNLRDAATEHLLRIR